MSYGNIAKITLGLVLLLLSWLEKAFSIFGAMEYLRVNIPQLFQFAQSSGFTLTVLVCACALVAWAVYDTVKGNHKQALPQSSTPNVAVTNPSYSPTVVSSTVGSLNVSSGDTVNNNFINDQRPDVELTWDGVAQFRGVHVKNTGKSDARRVMVIATYGELIGTSPYRFALPVGSDSRRVALQVKCDTSGTTGISWSLNQMIDEDGDIDVEVLFEDGNGVVYSRRYCASYQSVLDMFDIKVSEPRVVLPGKSDRNFFGLREEEQ